MHVRIRFLAVSICTLTAFASNSNADTVSASSDVTVELAGNVIADDDVVEDDLAGMVTLFGLGAVPESSDVVAYHLDTASGEELFSLDVTSNLGGLVAGRGDVVRFDGSSYSLEFDGASNSVPDGAVIDAVALGGGGLLLSFDTTVQLGGSTHADEDVVIFDGSAYTVFFDGSDEGVHDALDVDAASLNLGGEILAVSFDGSGSLGGFNFDDEDVLGFSLTSGNWVVLYDGSAEHAEWRSADLDALHFVPEPHAPMMLVVGILLLPVLVKRRSGPARGRGAPCDLPDV